MDRFALYALVGAAVLAVNANAFDGHRRGFLLGGGLGLGAAAKTTDTEYPRVESKDGGLGVNLLMRFAWDERNVIVLIRDWIWADARVLGDGALTADEVGIEQGVAAVAYYHYFGDVVKSFYVVICPGFQTYSSEYGTNFPSPGILIGSGYEFARHVQFHGRLSHGKTDAGMGWGGHGYDHTTTVYGQRCCLLAAGVDPLSQLTENPEMVTTHPVLPLFHCPPMVSIGCGIVRMCREPNAHGSLQIAPRRGRLLCWLCCDVTESSMSLLATRHSTHPMHSNALASFIGLPSRLPRLGDRTNLKCQTEYVGVHDVYSAETGFVKWLQNASIDPGWW